LQAAIHVIASQLGAELCEWTTPTPTLWQEHVHNSNSGIMALHNYIIVNEQIQLLGLLSSDNLPQIFIGSYMKLLSFAECFTDDRNSINIV